MSRVIPGGRVTELLGDHLDVHPGGECAGRGDVAQVVQPDRRQVVPGDESVETLGDAVGAQRPAVLVGEHQAGLAPTGAVIAAFRR